jgi:hypothetical protein
LLSRRREREDRAVPYTIAARLSSALAIFVLMPFLRPVPHFGAPEAKKRFSVTGSNGPPPSSYA